MLMVFISRRRSTERLAGRARNTESTEKPCCEQSTIKPGESAGTMILAAGGHRREFFFWVWGFFFYAIPSPKLWPFDKARVPNFFLSPTVTDEYPPHIPPPTPRTVQSIQH